VTPRSPLDQSSALWNRSRLDLRSDEVLAQILDRGALDDWRELYRLAAEDTSLRSRILHLCATVPMAMPHLFIAAMGALGEIIEPYPDLARDEYRDWV
jgi:hypothetical protein